MKMAKKATKKVKKKVTAELAGGQVQGEYVFVAVGAKPSGMKGGPSEFCSANLDLAANLRLLPGEEPDDAICRTIDVLTERFKKSAAEILSSLMDLNAKVRRGR
jgi:hypothetical protein